MAMTPPAIIAPIETDEDYMTVFVANDKIKSEYKKRADEGLDAFKEYADITFNQVLSHPEGVPIPFMLVLRTLCPSRRRYIATTIEFHQMLTRKVFGSPPMVTQESSFLRLIFSQSRVVAFCQRSPYHRNPMTATTPLETPSSLEIGTYRALLAYEDSIIVVDCGLSFPEDDMLGIDLVIPDINGFKYVAVGKAHSFWQFLSFNQNLDGGQPRCSYAKHLSMPQNPA